MGQRGGGLGAQGGDRQFAQDPACELRGVFNCAGPSRPYPSTPGVMYASEFRVPPVPEVLDPLYMTYYDYFNLWFTDQPAGGYFNQFVPQLYLGSVLCNSSNSAVEDGTAYNPHGISLSTWHLGSMYYFAVCDKGTDGYNCTPETWNSRAATGKLVPVEPGELVWTRFVLGPDWVWTLGMGVVGGGPDRESYVTAEQPFMGLLPETTSWAEDRYRSVSVGGCTEDYYMRPGSIPAQWEVNFTVTSTEPSSFWLDWDELCEATCPWAPKGRIVSSTVSADFRSQTARWEISM